MPPPRTRAVTWCLPKDLYQELQSLQESLKTPSGGLKWSTVEAMTIHFLTVSVREAKKEVAMKQSQGRLVQPANVIPPMLVLPGRR